MEGFKMEEMMQSLQKRREDLEKGLERLRADLYATDGAIQEVDKMLADLTAIMGSLKTKKS
jgi:prefoldin subunit 5